MADRRDTAGAAEAAETKLPELKFTEVAKSQRPVGEIKEGEKPAEIQQMKSFGDSTIIVLGKPANKITIIDGKGRAEENFGAINKLEITIDWLAILKSFGEEKTHFTTHDPASGDDIHVSKLPLRLQSKARALFKAGREYVHQESLKKANIALKGESIALLNNGEFVIVYDTDNDCFIAYVTKKAGVPQPPRNWQRLDAGSAQEFPQELSRSIDHIFQMQNATAHEISGDLSAGVSGDGVNIFKNVDFQNPVFTDRVEGVGNNLCKDPGQVGVIYYCRSVNPADLVRLDTRKPPDQWAPEAASFPQSYLSIENLQLDPSGNFFIFYSGTDLVVLAKDTLQEIKKVPNLTHVNFDDQGRIRAIDKDGHLVVLETNFAEINTALQKQRVARLAQSVDLGDIFAPPAAGSAAKAGAEAGESFAHLDGIRDKQMQKLGEVLAKLTTLDEVAKVRGQFSKLTDKLTTSGLKADEVAYVVAGLEEKVRAKETELAVVVAGDVILKVRSELDSGLSLATIERLRTEIGKVRPVEALVEQAQRELLNELTAELEQKTKEIFTKEGAKIIKDIEGLVSGVVRELSSISSMGQMADWQEFRLPQLKSHLGSLMRDCPIEAREAYDKISEARQSIIGIATQYEDKFKLEYAKVREGAAKKMDEIASTIREDIKSFLQRMQSKKFTVRGEAEQYISASPAHGELVKGIADFAKDDPEAAKTLERDLQVQIANALYAIERGAKNEVSDSGQQMVMFGKVKFPVWEHKVHEKQDKNVEVTFVADSNSQGPGIKARDVQGDICLTITNPDGSNETVRLYEDLPDEDEWRLGTKEARGIAVPPSYVPAGEVAQIKKDLADWKKGDKSKLQAEYQKLRAALTEVYKSYKDALKADPKYAEDLKQEYASKLEELGKFRAEHNFSLLRRIEAVEQVPAEEYTNGKGLVPEWQNHWVEDEDTERNLEKIARHLKMQGDLQEGLLNLVGHAGTGKDVLVKMFCSKDRANRPYFSTDCTKWTTEFELSEDVVLEAKDGATQTLKVPSAVLKGIQTPGAVVYFNELNGMPEQSQIFLHALFDEKRSLTLKTSSGKAIKAHKSVLFISSMNPGYPGTFDPQFATKSRMVDMEIGYPALHGKPGKDDKNPNPPYSASEALRVARSVDSLATLTDEPNLARNEFVKIWDHEVNRLDNGAKALTKEQQFDLEVILALVQFSNKLRDEFIKNFRKGAVARKALPVRQPITGRELRRCAYALSKMSPEEKADINTAEDVAKALLKEYFLSHFYASKEAGDVEGDREKVIEAMDTQPEWRSQKRVAA